MIVGNGLVASAFEVFRSDNNTVIFASGVSNSTETDPAAFEREMGLLKDCIEQHRRKKLIYFSTCSVTDPSLKGSPYIEHKLRIEEMIGSRVEDFVIFRVSNIVGGTSNPHTVMNYLVRSIANGREFCLWERAERNFIDIDDVVQIVSVALRKGLFRNETVNIANPRNTSIVKLVGQIERFLGKRAVCTRERAGGAPQIDISAISEMIAAERIDFGEDYVEKLLVKYYGNFKNADTAAPGP